MTEVSCFSPDNMKVIQAVAGTGLAPWEIHRPQKFVRELVLRRGFSGRVLDAGCGIGDNALYVAKACPAAEVTAVDVAPRCLDFVATKAGLRGMRDKVTLAVGDLRCYEALPPQLRVGPQYDIVLDSCTFHAFSDPDRLSYVRTLSLLLRTGGLLYMTCMSEEETQPGGPRRVRVDDVHACCNPSTGWEVESVEDTIIELHPTFYAGRSKARLFTIRRL
ncbi:hypothetical protein HYH03_014309 [Edaphochlamys debaryana]|uniref:Methyltransferase domain-containing protein n=1 Tax=Edaphochlamys debaryana TaxID=47281 RepID=A0A836BTN5_9CHLO|nr:hypothetical protein HYH03_014309 [Edaphochlamys debaryana]|eukprot:KAG2487063.1 hypothetical protein HYH03_014309 [Edaphochlamys debaryana]